MPVQLLLMFSPFTFGPDAWLIQPGS